METKKKTVPKQEAETKPVFNKSKPTVNDLVKQMEIVNTNFGSIADYINKTEARLKKLEEINNNICNFLAEDKADIIKQRLLRTAKENGQRLSQ